MYRNAFPIPIPEDAAIPFSILIYGCIIRGFSPIVNRSSSENRLWCMLGSMADGPHDSKGQPWLLYAWLILIIALLVLGIVSMPRIVHSIEESRMLELVRSHLAEKALSQTSPESSLPLVSLLFPIPGTDSNYTFQEFPVRVVGKRIYHETVEALLAGPPREALAKGAVSFIPVGTTLIGLSISNRIVLWTYRRIFSLRQAGEYREPKERSPS